jgi:uncharacterized protein YbcV (DUF1398 family)
MTSTTSDPIATLMGGQARAASPRPVVGGFPHHAEALRQAGIDKYLFDVASASAVYLMNEDAVLQPGGLLRTQKTIIPRFDSEALITAIRADQQGRISFAEFVEATFRAGVIRYEVDLGNRTCRYLGVHDETYVEHYPAVQLTS